PPARLRRRSRRGRARSRAAELKIVTRARAAETGDSPATAPLLAVTDLWKAFGAKSVLEGVDFEIAEGEKVCIVGPSGSGKTSLLRCLNLLIEPTRGKLYHRGDLVGHWPEHPPTINLRAYRRRI